MPCSLLRRGGAAALVLVLAVLVAPHAFATGDPACLRACAERWVAERKACHDALEARVGEIRAELDACVAACGQGNPSCRLVCERSAAFAKRRATDDFRKCVNRANTVGWNCARACAASRSRP